MTRNNFRWRRVHREMHNLFRHIERTARDQMLKIGRHAAVSNRNFALIYCVRRKLNRARNSRPRNLCLSSGRARSYNRAFGEMRMSTRQRLTTKSLGFVMPHTK